MKNISIKGILSGLVALIVLDGLLGDVLLTMLLTGGISGDLIKDLQSDSLFLILRMFAGAAALIGAGYLVERIAKTQGLINSGILGVISLALTIFALNDTYPIWYLILSYLYQFPSALAGGYIFERNLKRKNLLEAC